MSILYFIQHSQDDCILVSIIPFVTMKEYPTKNR